MGNLTGLLDKISHAKKVLVKDDHMDGVTCDQLAQVAEANVAHVVERIRAESGVLAEMESAGAILIAGAMYEVETGRVRFLEGA